MIKYGKILFLVVLVLVVFGLRAQPEDLCVGVDMKPVLSLEQLRMNELVDMICELVGIKKLPTWPADISGMTPEEYYQMEVRMLVENGFPPIFLEIEPTRLVNRRFFAEVMFPIAMEVDPQVKEDCKEADTETEQIECLVKHNWLYSKAGKIYREEILSILCAKKPMIQTLVPPIKPIEIYPQVFYDAVLPPGVIEVVIEGPATPF